MLEALLGSETRERVLLYVYTHKEAYSRELAQAFDYPVFRVQHQLARLEDGGVLYSRLVGRVRLYGLNPRNPLHRELEALLRAALRLVPDAERERLYTPRLRPVTRS